MGSIKEEAAENDRSVDEPIVERNAECCSGATVLLVDDVPFNLLPLLHIVENKFKQKCDQAVHG